MTLRALVLAASLVACKKSSPPPAPADLPTMSTAEAQRGQDACRAYVTKVCDCASHVATLQQACTLAKPLPEAIEVALSVAVNADSTRRDVLQANDSVRKIVKECIEETAKLPVAGCP